MSCQPYLLRIVIPRDILRSTDRIKGLLSFHDNDCKLHYG